MPDLSPIHPGAILQADWLAPLGVTAHRLATSIKVPPRRIDEIVRGKRGITADMALRLARFFGTADPQFWLNLQTHYDLQRAIDASGAVIQGEVTPYGT